MKIGSETSATLIGLSAVALWATVATGFKLGLEHMEPVQLLWVGCVVSTAVFAMARLFRRPRAIESGRSRKRDHLFAAGLGLVNPAAYYLILFEAYDRLPAQVAQPLNYTWAITLALLAIPVLRQPLTRTALAGIVVSYGGVVVLLTRGSTNFGTFDPLGIGLALVSTVLWASYWLASVRSSMDPVTMMLTGFLTATPVIGALCYFTSGLPALETPTVVYGAWVGLIEMGITFLLWQRALALTRHAARIGQLIFLSPFVSLFLIDRVLGESVHPSAIMALALIVVGVVLVNRATPAQRH